MNRVALPISSDRLITAGVVVAALGYFVDVYDLVLFSVVRVPSLTDLGVQGEALLSEGVRLLNAQMLGMLLGGVLWGVWGDKSGRVSVLFGSILTYSLANILNAFVHDVGTYEVLRFLAGIGLAGELGAGITLVAETLPRHRRGIGTTIVASIGVAGAVAAGLLADFFPWRVAYLVGGGMGFVLLGLRYAAHESGMFHAIKSTQTKRGNLLVIFGCRERFFKYLCCILVGIPTWYVIGILITFCPEIGKELGMFIPPSAGRGILYSYIGLVLGDLASGLLSQRMGSRKKAIALFIFLTAILTVVFLTVRNLSLFEFYCLCAAIGFAVGYWAVFVTTAAEQFGTNVRATVATTVPNFVRGAVVPLTASFELLRSYVGTIQSALIVGAVSLALAAIATWRLHESFHQDLDFLEE